jgi:serine/threonine protein kinase
MLSLLANISFSRFVQTFSVFENREKMVLVMEFAAGGELYDYLSDRKVLTEEEARRIFRQVSTAIYYCHKHKICHRDLKLENILLDENGNAKVSTNTASYEFVLRQPKLKLFSFYCRLRILVCQMFLMSRDCWQHFAVVHCMLLQKSSKELHIKGQRSTVGR